jgi:phosphate starvation-inducible protein PhoH and related proteins
MERSLKIENPDLFSCIAGPYDENIRLIEESFSVNIFLENGRLSVRGKNKLSLSKTVRLLEKLIGENKIINKEMIYQNIQTVRNNNLANDYQAIEVYSRKNSILPRTKGQNNYINTIKKQDLVFCIGPAGTGKTYLAMSMAVNYLIKQKVSRIILTRPAIEAGESLGFLPGNMNEKLSPYLRPLYDALYDMMPTEVIEEHLETGVIEVAPLAYMRGRTLNNSFIVLDEAQNCSGEQLKMFLTRLGFNSKVVITGDVTQTDLPGGKPVGLISTLDILKPVKKIEVVKLTGKDVVRHPLVQRIIEAYEKFDEKE